MIADLSASLDTKKAFVDISTFIFGCDSLGTKCALLGEQVCAQELETRRKLIRKGEVVVRVQEAQLLAVKALDAGPPTCLPWQ